MGNTFYFWVRKPLSLRFFFFLRYTYCGLKKKNQRSIIRDIANKLGNVTDTAGLGGLCRPNLASPLSDREMPESSKAW